MSDYPHLDFTLPEEPFIEDSRLSVEFVALYHTRYGWPPDEIAESFDVTLEQVKAALAYYFDHKSMIDDAISKNHPD